MRWAHRLRADLAGTVLHGALFIRFVVLQRYSSRVSLKRDVRIANRHARVLPSASASRSRGRRCQPRRESLAALGFLLTGCLSSASFPRSGDSRSWSASQWDGFAAAVGGSRQLREIADEGVSPVGGDHVLYTVEFVAIVMVTSTASRSCSIASFLGAPSCGSWFVRLSQTGSVSMVWTLDISHAVRRAQYAWRSWVARKACWESNGGPVRAVVITVWRGPDNTQSYLAVSGVRRICMKQPILTVHRWRVPSITCHWSRRVVLRVIIS